MNSYQVMVNEIVDIICKNTSGGISYVLIGDNSSGKSEILKNVVQRNAEGAVYFIDSVNRTFDADKVELSSRSYENIKLDSYSVVEERIDDFNFNLRDTFKPAACTEQLFGRYNHRVRKLCKSFLSIDIDIVRENMEMGLAENKVIVNENEIKLSSGYQALIRLFCEILFFNEVMEKKAWESGLVVIDEIDQYLSPKYSAAILNFFQKEFPQMYFLVTTHSLDLVKNIHDTNLIILYDKYYEIYGSSQMEDGQLADDIFIKLFFDHKMIQKSDNDMKDDELRRLLNIKIAHLWDERAQKDFERIGQEELKPHHRMIYKQIEEW